MVSMPPASGDIPETDAAVKMKAEVARRISLDDLSAAFQGNVYCIWRMMHLFNHLLILFYQASIAAPAIRNQELDPILTRAENLTQVRDVEVTTWIINLTIAFLRTGRIIVLQRYIR